MPGGAETRSPKPFTRTSGQCARLSLFIFLSGRIENLSRRFFAATLMMLAIATTGVVAAAGPADEAISLTQRLTAAEHQNGPASPALLPILAPLAQLRFEQG